MTNKTFFGLYRAETPLSHQADESMETTSICRYNTVLLEDGSIVKVYNISSASFRNDIRVNAAKRLLDLVDLTLEDIPEIANVVLLSGGPRLERSEPVFPLEYIRKVREWFPMLDLLGGTTQFCMIESKMAPTSLNALTKSISEFVIESSIISEYGIDIDSLPDVVTEFQFNVKADPRTKFDKILETGEIEEGESAEDSECRMVANMFDIQVIRKGTRLGHQVFIRDYDNLLLSSCFASSLVMWNRNGGYIGGRRAQGYGKVSWVYSPQLPSEEIYENFVVDNRDRIRSMIMDREIWKNQKAFLDHCE